MSKHYNRILELELRLSEELGEKTFVVPHVSIFIFTKLNETTRLQDK